MLLDSVYQIGPYTLSKHVLTVDERVVDRDFKVAETWMFLIIEEEPV